jgi:hypothetical protein
VVVVEAEEAKSGKQARLWRRRNALVSMFENLFYFSLFQ